MPPKKRTTVKQAKDARDQRTAENKVQVKAGADKIDLLIAKINKSCDGRGRIMRGSAIEKQSYARRSSGIPSLDVILNGGLPKGGLIEFGGPYSSGKTTLAMHCCAHEQQVRGGAIAWIALEPFDKRWARENGLFISFSEEETLDQATGEMVKLDSFDNASDLEKLRMEQAGITDPYAEVTPFVLVQEERGDAALDMALQLIESNEFAIVVIDSLGVAKTTDWVDNKDTQGSSDYPREPRMIGDYTTRALLMLNRRYDETNNYSAAGTRYNQTTIIHINQVVTNVGTMARTPWKLYSIKGGEGNKHNHHAIVFISRTQREDQKVPWSQDKDYIFGQEVRLVCIKSKLGPPFLEGNFDLYLQDYGGFNKGDVDVASDLVTWGLVSNLIERSGTWCSYGDLREQSRDKFAAALRENPEVLAELYDRVVRTMRQ